AGIGDRRRAPGDVDRNKFAGDQTRAGVADAAAGEFDAISTVASAGGVNELRPDCPGVDDGGGFTGQNTPDVAVDRRGGPAVDDHAAIVDLEALAAAVQRCGL